MVGALQYLTLTRPNIAYALSVVSQFMHALRVPLIYSVKRIFRYLQGTITHGLFMSASSSTSTMVAYSDVDWVGCPDSRCSTTGSAVFLSSNLISWLAKKQSTVSRSSTEAEYRVIACTVDDESHLDSTCSF